MKQTKEFNRYIDNLIYEIPQAILEKYSSHGKFLFQARNHLLLERQTPSGIYVYTAINLSTGEKLILSRRKLQLTKEKHPEMAEKIAILASEEDKDKKQSPKSEETIETLKTSRESVLLTTAKHIFTKLLPAHGYAIRENQMELTEHILSVISNRGISLAESEVGTGKTHAYLIATFLAKRGRLNDHWVHKHYAKQGLISSVHQPVIISTSSIALQKAIVKDYIPELSRILMAHDIIKTPLTAVIRKGKDHYVCERRLRNFYTATDERTQQKLIPFIGWHGSPSPFDLTDSDSLTPYMKKRICVSEKCSTGCKLQDRCRYHNYIKEANDPKIDFQITNHNYFLADTIHRAKGKRPLLPNYQLVIMDEAHKFLQAARQMYGLELTDKEIPVIAQEIHAITTVKSKSGTNVHKLAKSLETQSRKLFEHFNTTSTCDSSDDESEKLSANIDGVGSRYLTNITNIIESLESAINDSRIPKPYIERKDKVLWRLKVMGDKTSDLRKQSSLIHWFEKKIEGQKITNSLCAIPKNLNQRLHNDLWDKGIPIILTSGTLSASGDFTRTKEFLGLDILEQGKLSTTTMESPFDFRNNKLLYLSKNVPFPDNKDKSYIKAVADEIERLVIASHGHTAVLFTSYNAMGQVHALLKTRNLPFPLFRLERGGVHGIEQFKKNNNGILLASGSLWEGIDIPGDALSMLIIVKLPFAVPDPIGNYERELCGDMATFKQRVIIPDMLVKLKQGDGRVIRTEKDTGVCAILDIRCDKGKSFHNHVVSALSKCEITSSVEVVRDFFIKKKSASYFSLK